MFLNKKISSESEAALLVRCSLLTNYCFGSCWFFFRGWKFVNSSARISVFLLSLWRISLRMNLTSPKLRQNTIVNVKFVLLLYSILIPITSLVIPENFLFSLVRKVEQLYLPREIKLLYLPAWIQNGIKLHIYYLLWNQNRKGNFQGIFCSPCLDIPINSK